MRWINVHQKQFMARGSKAFLQTIKDAAGEMAAAVAEAKGHAAALEALREGK